MASKDESDNSDEEELVDFLGMLNEIKEKKKAERKNVENNNECQGSGNETPYLESSNIASYESGEDGELV
ncbi:hypothetical protein REPUB_Repub17cG0004400 [Reevesia pubescens]